MRVIEATEKHIDKILEMGIAFYKSLDTRIVGNFDNDTIYRLASNFIQNDDKTILVVEDENKQALGMALVFLMPFYFSDKTMIAHELAWWIQPKYRNFGTGKLLLDAIEKWAKEKGAKCVNMLCVASSHPKKAKAMYKKAGYSLIEYSFVKEVL